MGCHQLHGISLYIYDKVKGYAMYIFNKLVWLLFSPVSIGVELFFCALVFIIVGLRAREVRKSKCRLAIRYGVGCMVICAVWFCFWSMPIASLACVKLGGLNKYQVPNDSDLPSAAAIVSLGGGYCGERDCSSVRLWRLMKVPIIISSTKGDALNSKMLMMDLGVPESALIVDDKARNTEENALFVSRLLQEYDITEESNVKKPTVLLVTSWYHMKRSMITHKKIAPGVDWVPVVTKYGALEYWPNMTIVKWLRPSMGTLYKNLSYSKECLGIFGYRIRGF